MAQNPRISRFPVRGGLVGQNVKCKKAADNHPGQRGNLFSRFGAPSTEKLCFSVLSRARNFCFRPKTGQNTTKSPFPTDGGPTEFCFAPEKVAENRSGAGKQPCGASLLAAC